MNPFSVIFLLRIPLYIPVKVIFKITVKVLLVLPSELNLFITGENL